VGWPIGSATDGGNLDPLTKPLSKGLFSLSITPRLTGNLVIGLGGLGRPAVRKQGAAKTSARCPLADASQGDMVGSLTAVTLQKADLTARMPLHMKASLSTAKALAISNQTAIIESLRLELREANGWHLAWERRVEAIAAEETLDGIYVIRTSEKARQMSAEDAVRNYKRLTQVERAFRTWKGLDLMVRPRRRKRSSRSNAGAAENNITVRWLEPRNTRLERDAEGRLRLTVNKRAIAGIFAVKMLPATLPDRYLSLRHADADGQEHEIGLVRDLADWPTAERAMLEEALARRYFIRAITSIDAIEMRHSLLAFQVQTDHGPATFLMRNSHGSAQDFGPAGKL
jgi:Domain of unknown function (DUF1854)